MTDVDDATPNVVTVNVAVEAPDATVTLAGTVAAAVTEDVRVTTAPPEGALPVSVTVPVELVPPRTLVGERVTDVRAAGVTVRVAVWVTPEKTPEIVTGVEDPTPSVVTVNVFVEVPAATVTDAGTVAALVTEEERVTTTPPAGAGPVSVTVPVELLPPTTLAGATLTADRAAGVTVRPAVWVAPTATPVIVTDVEDATAREVTVNVAVVAPEATVTLAGTVAAAVFEEDRVTTTPPAGAGAVRVTVPVDGEPPTTLAGARLTEERLTGTGLTVSGADHVEVCNENEIVTGDVAATTFAVTGKLTEAEPAGTVAVCGTVAMEGSEL